MSIGVDDVVEVQIEVGGLAVEDFGTTYRLGAALGLVEGTLDMLDAVWRAMGCQHGRAVPGSDKQLRALIACIEAMLPGEGRERVAESMRRRGMSLADVVAAGRLG